MTVILEDPLPPGDHLRPFKIPVLLLLPKRTVRTTVTVIIAETFVIKVHPPLKTRDLRQLPMPIEAAVTMRAISETIVDHPRLKTLALLPPPPCRSKKMPNVTKDAEIVMIFAHVILGIISEMIKDHLRLRTLVLLLQQKLTVIT